MIYDLWIIELTLLLYKNHSPFLCKYNCAVIAETQYIMYPIIQQSIAASRDPGAISNKVIMIRG